MKKEYNRRTYLKSSSALVGLGTLAGCAGGGGGGGGGDGSGDGGDGGDGGGSNGGGSDGGSDSWSDIVARAEEEGEVNVIGGITGLEPFFEAFESEYGITLNYTRKPSDDASAQLLQESASGRFSQDVAGIGTPLYQYQLYEEGLYRAAPQPIQERYSDMMSFEGQIFEPYYGLLLTMMYDSEEVDDPPTSLDTLTSEWEGDYAIDIRDVELYAILRDTEGVEEADRVVSKIAEGNPIHMTSHYTMGEQISRKEFSMGWTYYKYVDEDWGQTLEETVIEEVPRFVNAIPIALLDGVPHPNAAAVYLDFFCSRGPEIIGEILPNDVFSTEFVEENNIEPWGVERTSTFDLEDLATKFRDLLGVQT